MTTPLILTRSVAYLNELTGDKRVLTEATIPPDAGLPVFKPAVGEGHDLDLIGTCTLRLDRNLLIATITLPEGKRPPGWPVATFVGSAPVPLVVNGHIERINIVNSVAAGVIFTMNPAWDTIRVEPDISVEFDVTPETDR